jgi:hypothetical protein
MANPFHVPLQILPTCLLVTGKEQVSLVLIRPKINELPTNDFEVFDHLRAKREWYPTMMANVSLERFSYFKRLGVFGFFHLFHNWFVRLL